MAATGQTSEATRSGILTTLGATVGLAFGPSVISTLTSGLYIPQIQNEFHWSRADVSFTFTIVAYRSRASSSTGSAHAA